MRPSLLLAAAAMAGPSAAEVVTMHLPAYAGLKPVGSVISSEKDKTTYSITCGSDTPATAYCPFGQNFRVTSAPSTIIFTQTAPMDPSMISSLGSASEVVDATCSSTNDATLSCTGALRLMSGSSTLSSTAFQDIATDAVSLRAAVTMTDKLPGGTAAAATPTPTGTGTAAAGNPNAASTSSTSSRNAGPRATQNAVLAGVAALIGGAAML